MTDTTAGTEAASSKLSPDDPLAQVLGGEELLYAERQLVKAGNRRALLAAVYRRQSILLAGVYLVGCTTFAFLVLGVLRLFEEPEIWMWWMPVSRVLLFCGVAALFISSRRRLRRVGALLHELEVDTPPS